LFTKFNIILIDSNSVDSSFAFRPILHKYANEDVSLGAWFIGLEVEHIDERNMCCGTPPGLFSFLVNMQLEVSMMSFVGLVSVGE